MRKWINIVEAAGKGDCYQSAWQRLMNMHPEEAKKWTLVHAEVVGSRGSAVEGKHFGHAWLETTQYFGKDNDIEHIIVNDYSSGREIELPQDYYYRLGEIIDAPGKLIRYTVDEAKIWAVKTGHYGSWELDVEGCGL